jgi:pilus assembly protein CpaF
MKYQDLKINISEYLKETFPDDVQNIYDVDEAKIVVKEATIDYLKQTNIVDNIEETAQLLYNDIFGLGIIDEIIKDNSITDISFNGTSLWVQSNKFGRYLHERQIDKQEAYVIIEKIAMQSQKQFNIANPILDVEYETIRINAIHETLSPDGRSFSIRIIRTENKINDKNKPANQNVMNLIELMAKNHLNIIISGQTGSGKSELQKYLIKSIPENDKIVVISDNNELKLSKVYPEKDIYTWIVKNENFSKLNIDFSDLIKPALRYNPEWLIISESRGKESFDMINAATTGHNIITTLHAANAFDIPTRLLNMCTEKNTNLNEKTLLKNIYQVLDIGIHMQTRFNKDKTISREIFQIVAYTDINEAFEIYNVLEKDVIKFPHHEKYQQLKEQYDEKIIKINNE